MFTLLLRMLFPMLIETKVMTKNTKMRLCSTISAIGYLSNLALKSAVKISLLVLV